MSASSTSPRPQPTVLPFAYPLDDFYAQAGLMLPAIETISGELVPEPYKTLLVHADDMTPTLERFHAEPIHLRVLSSQQRDDAYYREVVLVLDPDERPVEFGAIKINLHLFPPAARQAILGERRPLGTILHEHAIAHFSRPKAFLKVDSDAFINSALKLSGKHLLYGRRNALVDPQQRPLAEIVEILPPVPLPKPSPTS